MTLWVILKTKRIWPQLEYALALKCFVFLNIIFFWIIFLLVGAQLTCRCFYYYRCVSPDLMLSSSPESLISDHHRAADNKSPSPMVSPSVMYKLLIPLLRCEVPDMKDSVVHALGKSFWLLLFSFNNRFLRKRGMASTPKIEYQVFLSKWTQLWLP